MGYDVVIRNGTVLDGTGLAGYRADVGIVGDRIAHVGRIRERAAVEVDADGHVVTPGFIDGHTHMDAQLFWDPLGSCSCWHGVTTAVIGQCGFTLAPSAPGHRDLVILSIERAEDISPVAMAEGIDWSWSTFPEYLDAVDAQPKGINYVANVGHSPLRTFVMGERAFEARATEDEVGAMQRVLAEAIHAGAYGFTTSRTRHHATVDGRPVASRMAAWSELRALVGVLGDLDAGVFQLAEDQPEPDQRADWDAHLLELVTGTGVPVALPAVNGGRPLELIEESARRGGRMFGLTHPRGIGNMSSFRTRLPFDRLPVWEELRAQPLAEQERRLRDPEVRAALVQSAHNSDYGVAIGAEARKPEYERMQVLDSPLPPHPSVAEVARQRGVDPVEAIIGLALERDLDQFFVQTNNPFDDAAVETAMKHPRTVMAFSDAGAHVSQMSDASVQTHLLAHWVRDRQAFTLEEAVRMLTLAPARAWGFHDRGLVREGLVADLNVFDPDTVAPRMPTVEHDLPAGQPRIVQKAQGILATLVAGRVVHRDGEHTGALPGRLLRGPLAGQ